MSEPSLILTAISSGMVGFQAQSSTVTPSPDESLTSWNGVTLLSCKNRLVIVWDCKSAKHATLPVARMHGHHRRVQKDLQVSEHTQSMSSYLSWVQWRKVCWVARSPERDTPRYLSAYLCLSRHCQGERYLLLWRPPVCWEPQQTPARTCWRQPVARQHHQLTNPEWFSAVAAAWIWSPDRGFRKTKLNIYQYCYTKLNEWIVMEFEIYEYYQHFDRFWSVCHCDSLQTETKWTVDSIWRMK